MATTDSTPGTPLASATTQPRYVPGAPPAAPPTKSQQKKKRKSQLKTLVASAHDSALTDHAPDLEDIKAGKVDPSLLAHPAPASSGAPDTGNNTEVDESKPTGDKEKTVVAEAISKRLKTLNKKVQRVNEYKAQVETLNEDQKTAIAGLPSLEAGIKELEGLRKTVESLEASARHAAAVERAEELKANEQRVAYAAQHAEASLLPRITSLLSFLALRNLLTHATPTDLSISDPERNAILSAGDILLAHPPLGHVEEVVKGFLSGVGSWEDIEYARMLEITSQFAAPRPGTPIPDPSIPLDPTTTSIPEPEPEPEPEYLEPAADPEPEFEPEAEVIANDLGLPPPAAVGGGGFHFMQESELDAPADMGMSESQEWIAVQPEGGLADEGEGVLSEDVAHEAEAVQSDMGVAAGVRAPLDWAAAGDDGDELPDLGGLQATFGGSGSQTPIAQPAATSAPAAATPDDDGFIVPGRRGPPRGAFSGGERGYRGRARGRGGFRGGEGGGYRGDRGEGGEGGEGGHQGGGYRGRGGYRGEGGDGEGGYRGRGGYRGGDGEGRGGYRSGDGERRGGFRDGEGAEGHRGGRGRAFGGGWGRGQGQDQSEEGGRGGRGGYRGERRGSGYRGRGGAAPGTPTAETTA